MSAYRARQPDISIVTRARLLANAGWRPALRLALLHLGVYAGFAALHVAASALLLFNASSGQAAGLDSLPLDDAWIHAVYARSFAERQALHYNPGELEGGATSPLWVMAAGTAYRVAAPFGASLPAVAKGLGVLLALATSAALYHVAYRVSRNRAVAILAGAVLALDPLYSFAKLSGTEAALFGLLAFAAAAAFLNNRLTAAGILLALAVATRPEGLALAGLALAAMALKLLWEREQLGLALRQDLGQWLKVAGLPLLALVFVTAYHVAANGTIHANTYLVKHQDLGLFPFDNFRSMALGYFRNASYFGGYSHLATLPLLALAARRVFKQSGFAALPLVAFPLALFYLLGINLAFPDTSWTIFNRRYLDPALPFVAFGVVIGLNHAWASLNAWYGAYSGARHRSGLSRLARRLARGRGFNLAVTVVFLVLLVAPFSQAAIRWPALMSDYSWNTRNVNEVNVAMARWLMENTPPDAVIGVVDAGAIRYFDNIHYIVDLSGLNTHTAIQPPSRLFETAREHNVYYIVAFRDIYLDSWPQGQEIHAIRAKRNTILGGREMAVYQAYWDREIEFADKSVPYTVEVEGFELLDFLDVGDLVHEEAHIYTVTNYLGTVERIFHVTVSGGKEIDIKDEARVSTGAERFTVRSAPGKPLIIAKRYDSAVGGTVNVYADNRFVGEWNLPLRQFVFGEDTFRVAGERITDETTELRFEYAPRLNTTLNSFYYWIYTSR